MEDRSLAPCWDIQPSLEEKPVTYLLKSIAGVLTELPKHEHKLDCNWINGVRAYGWVKNHIQDTAEEGIIPELKMVYDKLDFVFAINNIPIQFSKDCISEPKKKHRLVRNKAEFKQLTLFGGDDSEAEEDLIWRVLAEPFYIEDTDDYPQWDVALVGINQYGACISEIRYHEAVSVPLMDNSEARPEATDISDAPLKRRNAPDETVKKDGTV
ncbi:MULTISPECIES: hypothetical protein [Proteus]|uniref:Uncharacterized protein n=1 Tax=Proteus mirabilis TaxID=584 RepID=A0AAJ0YAL8_PROMI|nr:MULTISPECIES: hypothetical protein [Proteus]ARX35363.1 hypothetical protein AM402_14765 [Proteus mirabilis]EJD6316726.1 hypothetical protein [Proteus mirabilis]EJD6321007.1 hypothetical protein [Proteus mirabilis]EJD6440932.1 hypothetical protein [Proteus mirabilis]EJD6528903.1 hypothetical protein [Proteus mirabilis]